MYALLKASSKQCCYCIDLSYKGSDDQFCSFTDLLFVVEDFVSLRISREPSMLLNSINSDNKVTSLTNIT